MSRLCQPIEQSRLALVMLLILSTLVSYVLLYRVGCCVLTDGVDVVAFRPELTSPQHPFDFGVVFEYLFGSDAFERLDDVLGRCCGD